MLQLGGINLVQIHFDCRVVFIRLLSFVGAGNLAAVAGTAAVVVDAVAVVVDMDTAAADVAVAEAEDVAVGSVELLAVAAAALMLLGFAAADVRTVAAGSGAASSSSWQVYHRARAIAALSCLPNPDEFDTLCKTPGS